MNESGFNHVIKHCKLKNYKHLQLLEHFVARTAANLWKVKVDESYFGDVRKGKRGRGTTEKTIVFGLLKRGGKIYTIPVADVKLGTLLPVIREKIKPDSMAYTDKHTAYNTWMSLSFHITG